MRTFIVHMTIMTPMGAEPYELAVNADSAFDAESQAHLIATEGEELLVARVGPVEEVHEDAV